MATTQLSALLQAKPFRPFLIRQADDRESIIHLDRVALIEVKALKAVIAARPELPEATKAGIVAYGKTAMERVLSPQSPMT